MGIQTGRVEGNDSSVRGVSKVKNRKNLWKVRFKNISEFYHSEAKATLRRRELENIFGFPSRGKRKDYTAVKNGEWEVVGDTGENGKHGEQMIVIMNNITKKAKTESACNFKAQHYGVGTGRTRSKINASKRGTIKFKNNYGAKITINYKKYWLGMYKTQIEAHTAYETALNNWKNNNILPISKYERNISHDQSRNQ